MEKGIARIHFLDRDCGRGVGSQSREIVNVEGAGGHGYDEFGGGEGYGEGF